MPRIMVIDDNWQLRAELCHALERAGYTVDEAGDGREALKMARKACPDVIVTDILMPNMEGLETIMEMRKIRPHVKIIAMSGGGRMKNGSFLDIAKQFGANAVLEKPFEIVALSDAVENCLRMEGKSG